MRLEKHSVYCYKLMMYFVGEQIDKCQLISIYISVINSKVQHIMKSISEIISDKNSIEVPSRTAAQ